MVSGLNRKMMMMKKMNEKTNEEMKRIIYEIWEFCLSWTLFFYNFSKLVIFVILQFFWNIYKIGYLQSNKILNYNITNL